VVTERGGRAARYFPWFAGYLTREGQKNITWTIRGASKNVREKIRNHNTRPPIYINYEPSHIKGLSQ